MAPPPPLKPFAEIETRTELAHKLGCSVKALAYVQFEEPRVKCSKEKCNYPAIARNYGFCMCCRQFWYPRERQSSRNNRVVDRGHYLLGLDHMRGTGGLHACDCESKVCRGIGYTPSLFSFPTDARIRQQWFHALGDDLSTARKEKINNKPRNFKLAHWHFDAACNHKILDATTGKWSLVQQQQYKDRDGKVWKTPDFPPPNASVQQYKEDVEQKNWVRPGGAHYFQDRQLPHWIASMCRYEKANISPADDSGLALPLPQRKHQKISPKAVQLHAARFFEESNDLQEQLARLQQRVAHIEAAKLQVEQERDAVKVALNKEQQRVQELSICLQDASNAKQELEMTLTDLQQQLQSGHRYLTFNDLRAGGLLARHVKEFTFFTTVECNEAFLDVLNFTDNDYEGSLEEGNGLCENYCRYSQCSIKDRVTEQHGGSSGDATTEETPSDSSGKNPSYDNKRGRKRKLDYRTEWLVYNLYIHAGWTERQIEPLFGVGYTTIYNIIYFWANFLNDALSAWFPSVTRSQIIRAYPESMLRKHGHCRIGVILDATEVFTQDATRLKVHACLFSAYKHHPTVKFLAGCDGIGVTWSDVLPVGFPGAVSDPVLTDLTDVLIRLKFGTFVQVDKGFLIDNDGVVIGVLTSRPMKMLKGQTQQSAEDTAGTQKVAHTRITIEQLNGGAKASARWLGKVIPLSQLGLLTLVMRTCFLMQNFHPGFVQGRKHSPPEGRWSRAEVRWYGKTEDGLFDARPHPELWATKTELKLFSQLEQQHRDKTRVELAELVLAENIPERLRSTLTAIVKDDL